MIYYYSLEGKRNTTVRKSVSLNGIRKMAYADLKRGTSDFSPSCIIYKTKANDVTITKDGYFFNPKTKKYIEGEYVGEAYIDNADPLFYRSGRYVFHLLSNGELGGIDRTLVL